MSGRTKVGILVAIVVVAAGCCWWLLSSPEGGGRTKSPETPTVRKTAPAAVGIVPAEGAANGGGARAAAGVGGVEADVPDAEPEAKSDEDVRAEEEERLVDAFDELTDRWMEPSEKGVTMDEVDQFVRQFHSVPKARQDECVHRALNLIPDENVMLLAGILMDRGTDKEIVEAVFGDILNRDEEVKKPILEQVFKDKKHPCWSDAAWILDVTGELPKGK